MMKIPQYIHTEAKPNGDVLYISDKAKIVHTNGNITGLCLDLRYWYDRNKGFIERKKRTDQEVIALGKKWASKFLVG